MDAATVVWLDEAHEGRPAAAQEREAARRALDAWARAHGVSLREPTEGGSPPLPVDLSIGDQVESDLDRGRDALAAQDADSVDHALAHAGGLLRAHPELPHAAWLLAEVERSWAARWARIAPVDAERAREAWARAAALDGGRAAGVGEPSATGAPSTVTARVALDGDGDLWVDGVRWDGGALKAATGDHQFVVTRGGVAVWAEWVSIGEGTVVRVALPEPARCSKGDLARAALRDGQVQAKGVRCGAWVAAGAGEAPRSVRVALCAEGRCGPLVEWSVVGTGRGGTTGPTSRGKALPTWATWTLVGVGAAAAGVLTALIATGAFSSSPGQTEFVNGGERVH